MPVSAVLRLRGWPGVRGGETSCRRLRRPRGSRWRRASPARALWSPSEWLSSSLQCSSPRQCEKPEHREESKKNDRNEPLRWPDLSYPLSQPCAAVRWTKGPGSNKQHQHDDRKHPDARSVSDTEVGCQG